LVSEPINQSVAWVVILIGCLLVCSVGCLVSSVGLLFIYLIIL